MSNPKPITKNTLDSAGSSWSG